MSQWIIRIVFFLMIVFFGRFLPAAAEIQRIAVLDPVLQPRSLHVQGDRAYVTEKDAIHIVSMGSGEILGRFGKRGEGPGEFKRTPVLRVYPDVLVVNTWGKILFYTPEGRYLREMKHRFGRDVGAIPLGDGYVAQKTDFSEKEQQAVQSFGIYDGSFKLIKTLFESPNPYEIDILPGDKKQPYPVIHDNISLEVAGERIYIADSRRGFHFEVYDRNGAPHDDIHVALTPRRVDESFRRKRIADLEAQPWWGQFKGKLEPVFPEFFPEIRFFTVRDDRIYVQTFVEEGDGVLFRVYDLARRRMSTVLLPRACDGDRSLYDIHRGRYLFLRLDDDTDTWELCACDA